MLDPENAVVRLCMRANEAELAGEPEEARTLLKEAWELASTHLEHAVAAHQIAHIQPNPQASHHWNREAIDAARLAAPEEVHSIFPSLLLAFAESLERVGSLDRAASTYREAIEAARGMREEEGYRRAAEEGIARVGGSAG